MNTPRTPPLDCILVYVLNGKVTTVPIYAPSLGVETMRNLRVMYPNIHIWEYSPAVLFTADGAKPL